MTQYLLSVHGPMDETPYGSYASEEEMQAAFAATGKVNDEMQKTGVWVFGGGLHPIRAPPRSVAARTARS